MGRKSVHLTSQRMTSPVLPHRWVHWVWFLAWKSRSAFLQELVRYHVLESRKLFPSEFCHSYDISKLKAPGITLFRATRAGNLAGIGQPLPLETFTEVLVSLGSLDTASSHIVQMLQCLDTQCVSASHVVSWCLLGALSDLGEGIAELKSMRTHPDHLRQGEHTHSLSLHIALSAF